MSHRSPAARALLVGVMLALLASLVPVLPAAAQNDRGLIDETSYQSPQFGYTLGWAEPWAVRDRDVITNPGGFDTITLRSDIGTLRVSGRADDYNPLTFLQDTIAIQLASGGEVINQDTTGGVPTAELLIGRDKMRLDVVSVPSAGAIVLISLRAPEASYADALASAQELVTLNDGGILDAEGGSQPVSTEGPTGTTATAPAGTTATTEAPVSTAVPTSTVEVLGSGIDGTTYTSPNFGFSVGWDPATWTVPDEAEYSEPGYDALRLESDTGPITVTGVQAYDGNAANCLAGEQTYYNSTDFGITEWQVAVDANGNELTGESENRAWGVFTNVFTDPENPNAEPQNFVDYIECVSLGDGASVVIFYSYATRDNYNDHIGKVVTLIESLDTPAAPASPTVTTPAQTPTIPAQTPTTPAQTPTAAGTATETPTATATGTATETPATTPTGAAQTPATTATAGATDTPTDLTGGDTVTGQTYGYSFQIPPGWQVNDVSLGGETERVVLTNRISTVGVEARAMSPATLSDCVANVAGEHQAQPIYTDLELALTSSGDPFSGEDDFSAFANFTFTGSDGSAWSHFVECRWIVQGESVLVVIQDVPQAQFGSERPARRQIQNSIVIGG